ncbi:LamG domain-containing protein [Aeoliella sp. ICT_H6.2]|uniref:LamG domain-containing protein n=1 Tax=Aeoliella straminimaris TaxID=2954799 RepID=A0A9X2JFR0_9BACT|nr:PEP-CTERM sorting domain-containing protein [Aeoliella straminimaris]MCO6044320.1 LamG domain-containing protein [Aeoliella straminimaris]
MTHLQRLTFAAAGIVLLLSLTVPSRAQIISLNFSENSANQGFVGGELIGPLLTDSTYWNSTNGQPDLANGTILDLIDSSGATTTADVTWSANNPYYNGDGTGSDEARLSVGYLDDGGDGISVELSQIPYTNYRVYGLYASDQANPAGAQVVTAQDMSVNGTWVFGGAAATSVDAYGSIGDSFEATGKNWSLLTSTQTGNYWTYDVSGTSTVTITQSPVGDPGRAALTGLIIRDLDAVITDPSLKLTIDRDTGDTTLINNTGDDVNISGVGLLSDVGGWVSGNWKSIASNYDQDGTISSDDSWVEIARTASDLSEATLTNGVIANGQSINLGDGLWTQYPSEAGTIFEYLVTGAADATFGLLEFVDSDSSNGEASFDIGDYNFDGQIDSLDWPTQRDNYYADLAGLSIAQSYQSGDIDGDGDNDLQDLLQFKSLYDAANGAGAFDALIGGSAVPEPSALALLFAGATVLLAGRRLRRASRQLAGAMLVVVLVAASNADAVGIGVNFRGGRADNDPAATGPDVTGSAGVVAQSNWNNLGGNFPATDHNATVGSLLNDSGTPTSASVTWSTAETYSSTANGPTGAADQDRNLMDGYLDAVAAQPTATVDFQNIPYEFYDVYVYVGSDGDDRTGKATLNGDGATDTWFRTNTGVDTFNSAADYIQATAPTEAEAVASNYILFEDVGGPSLGIGVTRGTNNVGTHGIQIVEELNPQLLTLQINTNGGTARILNDSSRDYSIDFFEITSQSSSLDETSWSPAGSGTNDGSDWETLGNLDDSRLSQFLLNGAEALTAGGGTTLGLGAAFKGGTQDLVFTYHDVNLGTRRGIVDYVDVGLPGDFNNDLIVDIADYTVWRNNLGADELVLSGNGNGSGVVDAGDYQLWKQNFGTSAGSGSLSTSSAVPEPTSVVIFLSVLGMAFLATNRSKGANRVIHLNSKTISCVALLACVWFTCVDSANAQVANVTIDRLYTFGEEETASAGQTVGQNSDMFTYDSVGTPGAGDLIDLEVIGDPKYVNVGPSGLDRPGAGSTLGAQFDGVDDVMFTPLPLNRPDVLAGPTELGDTMNAPNLPLIDPNGSNPYPYNYDNISARGMQMWVYPDAGSKLGTERQVIAMDTVTAGGVAITANGKWTQINSGHLNDTDIEATVDVVGDTWYHVMQHIYTSGDDNAPELGTGVDFSDFMSVVYVNGIAVSANADTLPPEGFVDGPRFGVLSVGAAEVEGDGLTPVYGEYFDGAIDDLEMYVYGDNSGVSTSPPGQDYGTFYLMEDNAWIAEEVSSRLGGSALIPGDANFDGVVSGTGFGNPSSDDVAALISNWRSRKEFEGAHNTITAGDFETWQKGDFNLDGVVDFSDWTILQANHPNAGSLNLGALLNGQAVPEPSTLVTISLAAVVAAIWKKRIA